VANLVIGIHRDYLAGKIDSNPFLDSHLIYRDLWLISGAPMEERIIEFISSLRAAGVRISLAESTDAFYAVEQLGVRDRDSFHTSLRATLVKDSSDYPIFEELFPLFFGGQEMPAMVDLSEDLTQEEAQLLADVLRQFRDRVREMLQRLTQGVPLNQEELERLAKFVGLTQIEDLRYREWMAQRMQKALRFREVREALQELVELLNQVGMNRQRAEQLQRLIQANLQSLEEQTRQYSGQRIAKNLSKQTPEEGIDSLFNRPFSSLSDRDMERLRKEVQRLAAMLRTRVALRQKRAKSGQLDAKATIRANLKHANVPIKLKYREKSLKPKLVVICDVSTSMRSCSELMLSLLYALQDQIKKTQAFVFIDHLEYISPDFEGREAREAVQHVLHRMPSGYYNTDFGNSLANFAQDYVEFVDNRTIFLIVGDGRNNYNDPRVDIFQMFARRSRRAIWLTPEKPVLWGTGDSDLPKYAPNCDVILQASTLAELTTAVDRMLSYP
jgi:uncharacterized protein with von Willebrand factor type A (vWA) domain